MIAADIALSAPAIIMSALGLFLMFRVLGELDLSVDATYTTGAAIAALTILSDRSPWLGLIGAFVCGGIISLVIFAIHQLGRTQYLLASLIVLTGMYSINLHILGGATVGLIGQASIFDILPSDGDGARIALLCGLLLIVVAGMIGFLHTSFGLAMRAAGSNPVMARANRVDTRATLLVGALFAGGLYAFGGALQAQIQGYADITMGIGAVIICVAAIFLGELLFPDSGRVWTGIAAVVVGGVLYTTILTLALRSGLPPTDLRLATAAILVVAVLLSRFGVRGLLRSAAGGLALLLDPGQRSKERVR